MTAALDITNEGVLTTLRAFLLAILPAGTQVVQGQVNRVAEPGDNFVVMTPQTRTRLATNRYAYADVDPTTYDATQATQIVVQLDIHGSASADNTQRIETLMRTPYAVDFMTSQTTPVAPLFADEGRQAPFINGEKQYEDRWIVAVTLQVNPTVSTPQQFADTLAIELVEVDTTFPPGA